MQFGADLLQIPGSDDPTSEIIARAQLLEELGFDFALIGHHRFTPGSPASMPALMGAIAASTNRLRIGPGVMVLPAYHPLDVAEQFGTLDQISHGRMILGVGVGYRAHELESIGREYRERGSIMTESLEVLDAVWTNETASYHGRHFSFDDVQIVPRPVQQPHPPIWIGAMSKVSAARAGTLADGWLGGLWETFEEMEPVRSAYLDAAAASGKPPQICLRRNAAISDNRDDLAQWWLPNALGFMRSFAAQGAGIDARWDDGDAQGRELLDRLAEDRALVGTADEVIRGVERCRELTGTEYLSLSLSCFGGDGALADAQLRRFAEEVIPAFR